MLLLDLLMHDGPNKNEARAGDARVLSDCLTDRERGYYSRLATRPVKLVVPVTPARIPAGK